MAWIIISNTGGLLGFSRSIEEICERYSPCFKFLEQITQQNLQSLSARPDLERHTTASPVVSSNIPHRPTKPLVSPQPLYTQPQTLSHNLITRQSHAQEADMAPSERRAQAPVSIRALFGASSESGLRVSICPFKLSSLHIEAKDIMNKSIPKNHFFKVVIISHSITSATNEHNYYLGSITFSWGQNSNNTVKSRNPSAPAKCIQFFNLWLLHRKEWVPLWEQVIFVKRWWHEPIVARESDSLQFTYNRKESFQHFLS